MAKSSQIDLSISLLSFNTKDFVENCLNSIYKQSFSTKKQSFSTKKNTKNITFEVLLVDNGSKDNTPQMVEKKFPKVKLIKNKKNLLYIKGHNQNLKRVKGRYFLVLNEDTEIGPKVLEKMVKFMDKNPKIGLASCREVDQDGKVDKTCSTFPHPLHEIFESSYLGKLAGKMLFSKQINGLLSRYRYGSWNRATVRQVEVIPGSFFMGRSGLLQKVGLFDEKNLLFFYGEPDYCQRVKKAKYQVVHNGKLTIKHLKAKGLAKLSSLARYQITQHDILAYYRKHFGSFWMVLLAVFLLPNWLYWRAKSLTS